MVAGQIPAIKIYEDEVVLAFLDIGPVSDGHTLVIPKQHFEKLHDCPAEVLGQVTSRLGKVAKAVTAGINSQGYNLLCNNGRAAGQLVEHLHFHIIPRNTGDGVFDHWPAYEYEQGKIEAIAAFCGILFFVDQ
jgi:histidine triad (HIT) family protein